ncbi:MAG: ribbon-helix-helix domain-containing protein [Candidatus Bipolaricaulota bacterium]|nr:ribbon-helix-helix domain-containing protein [Candidatus Bipolaricaulota bacterium]
MATAARKKRKVTLTLPAQLVEEIKALVDQGQAPSQSAFVAEALAWKLQQARHRQHLREEFRAAATDPLFLRDLEETAAAFRSADRETAQMIPD